MIDYPFWVNDFDRVKDHRLTHPQVAKIFDYPVAFWYGTKEHKRVSKTDKLEKSLKRLLKRSLPQLPYFVLYNMPNRDIGQYSKGGAKTGANYFLFLQEFCRGINGHSPIIIFEPDAIPHTTMMDKEQAEYRFNIMKEGLTILTEESDAYVYVDVGHSNWLDPSQAHELLSKVWVKGCRGFSVNVSNYRSTEESNTAYTYDYINIIDFTYYLYSYSLINKGISTADYRYIYTSTCTTVLTDHRQS